MQAGVSTLGIEVSYAMETEAGSKPAAFSVLHRINETGELNPDQAQIDASALEDYSTKNIPGRDEDPGTYAITVNRVNDTVTEWETLCNAYWNRTNRDLKMWFQIKNPDITKADFVIGAPPKKIPIPGRGQNSLETMVMNITVSDYESGAYVEPANSGD